MPSVPVTITGIATWPDDGHPAQPPGYPTHPIYLPGVPTHPIAGAPPVIWPPAGVVSPPIYYPPPPTIWPSPGVPTNPIYLPPPVSIWPPAGVVSPPIYYPPAPPGYPSHPWVPPAPGPEHPWVPPQQPPPDMGYNPPPGGSVATPMEAEKKK
jgi:hypothetical protein